MALCAASPSTSLSVRSCPQPRDGPGFRLIPRGLLSSFCIPAYKLRRSFPSSLSRLSTRRSPGSISHLHYPTGLKAAQREGLTLPPYHACAFAVRQIYQGDGSAQPQIVSRENLEPPSQPSESVLFTFNDKLEGIEVEGGGGDIKPGGGDGSGWNGGDGKPGNGGDGEGESEDKSKKMSVSQKLTLAYAALVAVGGAIGYAKGKSMKSLISGAVSSLLLCYVFTQLPVSPVYASSIGLGVSGVLLAVFGVRLKKSGKIFPAGVLSLVSFIMAGGYIHGIMRASHA